MKIKHVLQLIFILFIFLALSMYINSEQQSSFKKSKNIEFMSGSNELVNEKKKNSLSKEQRTLVDKHSSDDILLVNFYKNDYHSFVNKHLENAKEGDPKAQFFVSKALDECKQWVDSFNINSKKKLDQLMLSEKVYGDETIKIQLKNGYDSCHKFVGEDILEKYGSSNTWFQKSLEQNFPSAVIEQQSMYLFEASMLPGHGEDKPRDPADNVKKIVNSVQLSEPHSLLSLAALPINFGVESEVSYTAWVMLACDNGLPCNKPTRLQEMFCLNTSCDSSLGFESLLESSISPQQFQTSKRLSAKLRSAIESGDWSEISPQFSPPLQL